MRSKLIVVGILAVIAAVAVPAFVTAAANNTKLEAKLAGDDEPDGGDPNGKGKAEVTLKPQKGKACFFITFKRIGPPTAGHIHEGKPGEAGPIVVPFLEDPEGATSPIDTCVKGDEGAEEVLKDIKNKPKRYYVNLHNEDLPGGAIRGQLSFVPAD